MALVWGNICLSCYNGRLLTDKWPRITHREIRQTRRVFTKGKRPQMSNLLMQVRSHCAFNVLIGSQAALQDIEVGSI
eukprot:6476855-Amphidinium_carterae.2